jgi:sugar/nucleoside kinase (ribokinase family)
MTNSEAPPSCLFVGLCTQDIIQMVDCIPHSNEKVTALKQMISAGGPATNAAVTYACLGGRASLLTGIGGHSLGLSVRSELEDRGVSVIDSAAGSSEAPPVSAIMITAGSGDRAVVSINTVGRTLRVDDSVNALVADHQIVFVDGYYHELAMSSLHAARDQSKTTILDGGSWKAGTTELLPYIDIALCSADFHPPGVTDPQEVFPVLSASGVQWSAITRGAESILWGAFQYRGEVVVPRVDVVDTLGAGDVFHGACSLAIGLEASIDENCFVSALRIAAQVAATSCTVFGTRAWMDITPPLVGV